MKKILFAVMMFVGLCMASCNCNGSQACGAAADSTSVDTAAVDTVETVDTVAADSTVCPD